MVRGGIEPSQLLIRKYRSAINRYTKKLYQSTYNKFFIPSNCPALSVAELTHVTQPNQPSTNTLPPPPPSLSTTTTSSSTHGVSKRDRHAKRQHNAPTRRPHTTPPHDAMSRPKRPTRRREKDDHNGQRATAGRTRYARLFYFYFILLIKI